MSEFNQKAKDFIERQNFNRPGYGCHQICGNLGIFLRLRRAIETINHQQSIGLAWAMARSICDPIWLVECFAPW